MGKFSFVKAPLKAVLTCINSKDFKQKYVNEDGSIKQEFIDIVYPKIQEALGINNNNVPEPLSVKESGIKYKVQMEKVKEYISSILSKIKYDSNDWENFVKSINNSITDIGNNEGLNPYTLFPTNREQKANLLSNTTFYIWHRTPENEAQLYMDKLPPVKSAISVMEDNFKLKKDKLENDIEEKRKYLEGMEQEIDKMKKELKQTEEEKNKIQTERDKARKGFQIAKDNVEGAAKKIDDIHTLLTGDERKILDDVARQYGYDPSFKENLRKIKEKLKASDKFSDNQINYIITKASDDYAHMRKMMESNPDMFERDMSNDTIQKENEQFQSKLRQQNLRYILPKFIERREKLVENTLNPNLLKGAFAI